MSCPRAQSSAGGPLVCPEGRAAGGAGPRCLAHLGRPQTGALGDAPPPGGVRWAGLSPRVAGVCSRIGPELTHRASAHFTAGQGIPRATQQGPSSVAPEPLLLPPTGALASGTPGFPQHTEEQVSEGAWLPHLGEQVAVQPGVGHRAAGHVGQESDEPLHLMQYGGGIGQGPLVLRPGWPPRPQHTVQLLLHPVCGGREWAGPWEPPSPGPGGPPTRPLGWPAHTLHAPCTLGCLPIRRAAHCSVAEVVSVPAMTMSRTQATTLVWANRPSGSPPC